MLTAARPESCSFSADKEDTLAQLHLVNIASDLQQRKNRETTHLPLLHIILLRLVLLGQLHEHLVHVVRVGLQLRQHIANSTLDEYAVDHAEAFAGGREGSEGF